MVFNFRQRSCLKNRRFRTQFEHIREHTFIKGPSEDEPNWIRKKVPNIIYS